MVHVFTIPMEILFVKRNENNVFVFLSLSCFIVFFEHFEAQKKEQIFWQLYLHLFSLFLFTQIHEAMPMNKVPFRYFGKIH